MPTTHDTFVQALERIADSKHVLLTTFRKDGRPVPTPVGGVVHDGTVYALTDPTTGKVKRIRNNPRVAISPCSMNGTVPDGAPKITGTARLLGNSETARVQNMMKHRFFLYRLIRLFDRAMRRQRPLVAIAITAA
ncbi:PPOX class F420-dependent oxidoreductase [Streptomyces triticiradicis]|uniref:PPOX class F420-dependent oxidoreductase n=1 Tax=Streptomyces triticiradicis TaxID=2651189 RepID=A0A7J5D8H8_9ACTN|nr:PPOX class F420-dependent oxidoreductase [Streptomyces triticiradicis]KAB1982844.1 PPOX class F420-dependent oxidoreductase [Streptomyces triticiradicis]